MLLKDVSAVAKGPSIVEVRMVSPEVSKLVFKMRQIILWTKKALYAGFMSIIAEGSNLFVSAKIRLNTSQALQVPFPISFS